MRPLRLALALVALAPAAAAQTRPMEYARPSPAPERVGHGELVAFARDAVAARDGDRVLVAWIDHTANGNSQLRTTLLRRDGDALVRARPDAAVVESMRTPTLAWDGHQGLLAWVVPPPPPPPRAAAGAPAVRRPASAPPVDETLGLRDRSGGDLVVQRLDGEGRPAGAARVVFHENSRLGRVAVALDDREVTLAWSGAVVTDDEVRGTVRVLRLGADLEPATPMALNTGFVGEVGATLSLASLPEHATLLRVGGSACRPLVGQPSPVLFTTDASAQVEAPNRSLMPQQPLREVEGPPVACDPPSIYETTIRPGQPIAPPRLVAAGAPEAPTRAPDLTPRVHPPPGYEPALSELPVAPPDAEPGDPFAAPRVAATDGPRTVVVDRTSRVLAMRTGERVTELARSEVGFTALTLLPGAPALALTREGVWSGPLRAWRLDDPGVPTASLGRVSPVPTPVVVSRAPPVTAPYVYDETFARLWVRARTARAVFMRHENLAGALAARPEAPTDPRMPGVLANRTRLRGRWESACGALQTRAAFLARRGAGNGPVQGVQSLCEMHPDLVLGQPINPAL